MARRSDTVVLTPHAGEFRRLFPDLAERWAGAEALSKLDVTRDAAKRSGAVVLLKGADTVIATPIGPGRDQLRGLRPRGSVAGDGGGRGCAGGADHRPRRARMPDLARAVEDAAWLHVETAREAGPGMIAEDLPEACPPSCAGCSWTLECPIPLATARRLC
jgi:NAD(P)H-hydrate repair Nnr-like enzyme with NAD(P)H-hydrate dehydratase domain